MRGKPRIMFFTGKPFLLCCCYDYAVFYDCRGGIMIKRGTDHLHVEVADTSECCGQVVETPLSEAVAADLARVYAALADPVRLRLLSLVAVAGELCSCDLQEPLAKSQPTVSHHTRVLADAGLLEGDKRGRWVYWRIAGDRRDFVRQAIELARPGAPTMA